MQRHWGAKLRAGACPRHSPQSVASNWHRPYGTNFNTIGIFVPLTAEDETIEEELKILEQALAA